MSTSKHINRICWTAVIFALLLTTVFVNGEALGIEAASTAMGYETRLFDASTVHTIDIVMDDWDGFLETCEDEEYIPCSVVIDNEAYKNVAIRAKGNTSLSTVSQLGSQRYSFKIEFGHYDSGNTYYGLDKLSLNNLIQDNTMMKDYLTYQMMGAFGVAAPLCSFVYITVNGEDWGLYLAVEGVEDAFLQRNYGSDAGMLYKPDSSDMGGGPGNGRNFQMDDFREALEREDTAGGSETGGRTDFSPGSRPDGGTDDDFSPGEMPDGGAGKGFTPEEAGADFAAGEFPGRLDQDAAAMEGGRPGGVDSGIGSEDVKLQYIDDDPDSYANIFDNAKTGASSEDQARLIAALKALSEGDVESSVDVDQVLRYFVVHNFVVNGDSYTGSIVHNYYLYEQDGLLSMIPWDYNLAFGGFQSSSASDTVNDPIDTPLSVTGDGTRPMIDWIFQSEEYTALYHQYFAEFLETVDIDGMIERAYALIAPYVERDPTKFCADAEFELGVSTLREFCRLRCESVTGQLDGSIPSTASGQRAQSDSLIDASAITISDMGSMNNAIRGGGRDMDLPSQDKDIAPAQEDAKSPAASPDQEEPDAADAFAPQAQSSDQSGSAPILLGVSLFVLLVGLIIAFRFKRSG